MTDFATNFSFFSSIGVILGQLFLVFVVTLLLAKCFGSSALSLAAGQSLRSITPYGLILGFLTAVAATVASLIYSNIIGFTPCELCWIQRIFLYPQVVILGLALWKKTKDAELYCLVLSVIGAVVAGYHFYGQSIDTSVLPACDATGATSCAVRYFVDFGYVTIPMMSFTAFLLILTCMVLARTQRER